MNDNLQPPTTTYVSRVVAVPTELAGPAFDACRADRQHRSSVPGRWILAAGPRALLVLDPAGAGVLRMGAGRRRAVELEVRPWSRTATELGLRFVTRWSVPPRAFDVAWAVLDGLAAEIELRALLARHPEHAAGDERRRVVASAWL